jgi:hypothetical protein
MKLLYLVLFALHYRSKVSWTRSQLQNYLVGLSTNVPLKLLLFKTYGNLTPNLPLGPFFHPLTLPRLS